MRRTLGQVALKQNTNTVIPFAFHCSQFKVTVVCVDAKLTFGQANN